MRFSILLISFLSTCGISFSQSSYTQILSQIKIDKASLKKGVISDDSIKNYLLYQFETQIYPPWIGTPWDYNGYSNTPRQSTIACGYFVSTTLKHMGFNWNRYELAKMYSQQIVEDITDTAFVFDNITQLCTYIRFQPDNLYIIGLGSHVGLILKRAGKIWFIHSNYYGNKGPDKENLFESDALKDSNVFWCGKFLTPSNIKMWLDETEYGLVRKK
jgi:hypothetical protein